MSPIRSHDLVNMLARRYGERMGSTPRYLLGEEVRLASFGSPRICDVIVQDTWTGGHYGADNPRQYPRHGFEIKISRSDWLNEVRQPDKAEAFRRYCHYWYLVIADKDMVKDGELPQGWGLLVPRGNSLVQIVKPEENLQVEPMPVGMMISFMRRVESATRFAGENTYRVPYIDQERELDSYLPEPRTYFGARDREQLEAIEAALTRTGEA